MYSPRALAIGTIAFFALIVLLVLLNGPTYLETLKAGWLR